MYKFIYKLYVNSISNTNKMNKVKCISCKQTTDNCECKHRGLIHLIKEIIKNESDKPETKGAK